MKRVLQLTSPTMEGFDVEYAQRVLQRGGVWKTSWYTGKIDGEFGQKAALAAKQAKYDLGYADKNVTATFGTSLEKYILGTSKLTPLMKLRRSQRAKQNVGLKALTEAKTWVGTHERPAGSNICKPFTTGYGGGDHWGAPWCAVFVSYCLNKAGFKHIDPKAQRWAYCPYVLAAARAHQHGLKVVKYADAKPGDIVLFDGDNDGVADHIGFLDSKASSTTFRTVEGNTSATSNSNGGEVQRRQRFVSDAIAFVTYQ